MIVLTKMKYLILFSSLIMLVFSGCKKDEPLQHEVVSMLYKQNPNGEILACTLNNQKVYCLSQLVYDGGTAVYNETGDQIGTCNYAWGPVDAICSKLINCEVVYRAKSNAFNLPFIDKYGLSR